MSIWSRRRLTASEDAAIREAVSCFLRGAPSPAGVPVETHSKRLVQRRKQLAIGKEHSSYQRYVAVVPRSHRPMAPMEEFPRTPPAELKCSKRGFDSLLRRWRRALHMWTGTREHPLPATRLVVTHGGRGGADQESDEADYDDDDGGDKDESSIGLSESLSRSTDSGDDVSIERDDLDHLVHDMCSRSGAM